MPRFDSNSGSEAGKKSKRGISIKSALKRQLREGKIDSDTLALAILKKVLHGDAAMTRLVMEHLDGKPKDTVDLKKKYHVTVEAKDTKVL